MAQYHRNDTAGPQATSMRVGGRRVRMTFRSLKDDLAALRAAAPAGIVDPGVTSIGKSEQDKDIHAIRIGKNPSVPVLIAGCHHAREWISVEIPFLIAEFLVNNYNADENVRRIVDARDIWIVPLINPDGHENSVLNDRLWRKNFPTDAARKKVDLNRNYATAFWNTPTGQFSDDPNDDAFRGPSPAHAKEVVAMQNLIKNKKFKGTLDFHSFGRFVLFPWAGRTGPHPDALQDQMGAKVEGVIDSKGTNYLRMTGAQLYPHLFGIPPDQGIVPGGMMDFVVEQVADSIAVTVELEPDHSDPRGFVLPESEIQPTFDLHRGAILTFLNCIGSIRRPPASRRLLLQPDVDNALVVFQSDCSKAFAGY